MQLRSFRDVFGLLTSRQRLQALELVLLMVLSALLETFGIALVVPIVAIGATPQVEALGPWMRKLEVLLGSPGRPALMLVMISGLAGVFLFKAAFLIFCQWRQGGFIYGLDASVADRLSERYLRQPWIFHTQRNSADLFQSMTSEATEFRLTVTAQVVLLADCVTVFAIAVLLFIASPTVFVTVSSAFLVAGAAFHAFSRRRVQRWGQVREQQLNLRYKTIMESLGTVKELLLYGRQVFFLERLSSSAQEVARVSKRFYLVTSLPRLALESVAIASLAMAVAVMIWRGWPLEQIAPVIGIFVVAAVRILPSTNRILTSIQQINFGTPAVARMLRECSLPMPWDDATSSPKRAGVESIEFERVTFRYPGSDTDSIKEITLAIEAGTTVAFIGTSGAGKSTMVDLLLGLLRPSAGVIKVGGRDLHADTRAWQANVGYVPQTITLIDDTIRANVAFGISPGEVDDDAVLQAIRAAQLDEFIGSLPAGLDSKVGERGVRLSGGQRQRIGIARALYGDPPTLVLDEATSALDVETEAQVMAAIDSLRGTRTIVIVAHRLSTIEGADRVFRLEGGQLNATECRS